MDAKTKFYRGDKLSKVELLELSLMDRCRYVVERYFQDRSFSAGEVAAKLTELNPNPQVALYTPMEINECLREFYGTPDES